MNKRRSNHSDFTLRFRGVRGSIPSPGRETARYGGNTSCIELRYRGHLLILDAGSGIRALGSELLQEVDGGTVRADLLISHTHWDHIQGFPFFAPAYSAQHQVQVYGGQGLTKRVEEGLRNQMSSHHFPVSLDQMHGLSAIEELNGQPSCLGPYLVRTTGLNHPGGCVGFRIETESGSLAYFPDHEPFYSCTRAEDPTNDQSERRRALIDFARGVDLLILDTQYSTAEYARHIGWGHGCLPDSVSFAMETAARRFLLFHHDPSHDDDCVDNMVSTARELAADSGMAIDAASENGMIQIHQIALDSPRSVEAPAVARDAA